MNTKELREKKKKLKLKKRQKEIVIGLMLGDGCLETQNNGRTYRLKVEQSVRHKEYVDWLYKNFQEFVNTVPKKREKEAFGKKVINYGFSTLSVGNLRFFAQQFYKDTVKGKKIPVLIKRYLTPLSMAVWFMDDGQIKSKKHRALLINTQCFSKRDLRKLQKALKEKFGIKTSLKKEPTGWRLYFLSETVAKFVKLIKPHILPSMRRKLGININA
jgi:membrane-bound lytic murein transglycosylase